MKTSLLPKFGKTLMPISLLKNRFIFLTFLFALQSCVHTSKINLVANTYPISDQTCVGITVDPSNCTAVMYVCTKLVGATSATLTDVINPNNHQSFGTNGCLCGDAAFSNAKTFSVAGLPSSSYKVIIRGTNDQIIYEKIFAVAEPNLSFSYTANPVSGTANCSSGSITGNLQGNFKCRIPVKLIKEWTNTYDQNYSEQEISTIYVAPTGDHNFLFPNLATGFYRLEMGFPSTAPSSIFRTLSTNVNSCAQPQVLSITTTSNSAIVTLAFPACGYYSSEIRMTNTYSNVPIPTINGNILTFENLTPNTQYQGSIVNRCPVPPIWMAEERSGVFVSFKTNP